LSGFQEKARAPQTEKKCLIPTAQTRAKEKDGKIPFANFGSSDPHKEEKKRAYGK